MNHNFDIFILTNTTQLLNNKIVVSDDIGTARFLEIVHGLSWAFATVIITMIGLLLINTIRLNRLKESDKILKERYQDYLANFISIPIKDELSSMGVTQSMAGLSKSDITNSRRRTLLLDELYNLHQQLDGYQAEMLKHLFWGWSMQEEAISNLTSRSVIKQIRSLDILMEFDVKDQLPKIRSLVTSNHMDVRSQAMACLTSMNSGNLEFLSDIHHSLTYWEKHKILSAMTDLKDRNDIDFDSIIKQSPGHHKSFIEELQLNIQPQFHHYSRWIEQSVMA